LPDYSFAPPAQFSCTDNLLNGKESDTDCGGTCPLCANGSTCRADSDCAIGSCFENRCQAQHCANLERDATESDVNCGGDDCPKCGVRQNCNSAADCKSNACMDGQCVATGCDDDLVNNLETDLDCGGGTCPGCGIGQGCGLSGDCESGFCIAEQCSTADCADTVKQENEEGVDCGGVCPKPCDQQAACADERKNGLETDIDCGGSLCARCALTKGCLRDSDCESDHCLDSQCAEACTGPCGGPEGGAGGAGGSGNSVGGEAGEGNSGAPGQGGRVSTGGTGGRANGGGGGTLQMGGGGSGGTLGGSGGASGGTTGGVATGGAATGGAATGGAATGGAGPLSSCTGCARLSVPLTSASQKANYVIFLPNVANFSNARLTYRIYREAGSGGQIKGYVQHGGSPDFLQLFESTALPLTSGTGWTEFTWDIAAENTGFDKTQVGRVGIQIIGTGATSWTNPTVVSVDSITASGVSVGPWNFDSPSTISSSATTTAGANIMFKNAGDSPVANATISWFGR
jgi:hypothetical protein